MTKTVFITGVAGFVGAALAQRLLGLGWQVHGIDNENDYYTPALKQQRIQNLRKSATSAGAGQFVYSKVDLTDAAALARAMAAAAPQVVVHLAAQAGVRYGLQNPQAYLHSNLIGHFNLLEACRALPASPYVLYASSSSVYGANDKIPFVEEDDVLHPQSLYAATKVANEAVTHAYCKQFGLVATGLRFFTVYGPWGRPDMSPMLFASAILEKQPIPLFGAGELWRDFTYIDDVVAAIEKLLETPAKPAKDGVNHQIYNIGNHNPVKMTDFVQALEAALGEKAIVQNLPCPPTEVPKTFASTEKLKKTVGWAPATSLADGLQRFAQWYVPWHNAQKQQAA